MTNTIDLDPAIAELLAQAEREIAEENERKNMGRAREEAKMDAFLARQTAMLLDQLNDQIPPAVRPYIKAADAPRPEFHQTEDWFPAKLLVAIPGLSHFVAFIRFPPYSNAPGPAITNFYDVDYNNFNVHTWSEALTEARSLFLWRAERIAGKMVEHLRRREADEREPSTAERLAALIEEIVVNKVSELMEV